MPRPRKFKEGVVVSVYIPKEWYALLRAAALSRGISISDVVREALGAYVVRLPQAQIPTDPLSPSDPASLIDPLTQVEWEELEERLSSLEKRTAKLEERVKAVAAGGSGLKLGPGQQLQDLRKWLWDLRGDWTALRNRYRELRSRVPADWDRKANERLAQLKRRIDAIAKLLHSR